MTLSKILAEWDQPVNPKVTKEMITYMKSMPAEKEELVLQCAAHLEKSQTLGAVLAVVHALNEGEFLLRHQEDSTLDELDLAKELEKLMNEDTKKEDAGTAYQDASAA